MLWQPSHRRQAHQRWKAIRTGLIKPPDRQCHCNGNDAMEATFAMESSPHPAQHCLLSTPQAAVFSCRTEALNPAEVPEGDTNVLGTNVLRSAGRGHCQEVPEWDAAGRVPEEDTNVLYLPEGYLPEGDTNVLFRYQKGTGTFSFGRSSARLPLGVEFFPGSG